MGGINLGGLASGFESGMGNMESLRQKAVQLKQAQFDLDQQKQKVAAEAQRFMPPKVGAGLPGAQAMPPGAQQGMPPAGPGGVAPFQPPPQQTQGAPPPGPGGVAPMGGPPPGAAPPQGPPPGAAPPQGVGGVNVLGNMAAAGVQPQGQGQMGAQGQGGPPDPMQEAIAAQQKAVTFINQNYPNASPQQKSFLFQDLMQSMKTQDPLLRAQLQGQYGLMRQGMVGDQRTAHDTYTEGNKNDRQDKSLDYKAKHEAMAAALKEKLAKLHEASATGRTSMTQAGANSRAAMADSTKRATAEYQGSLKAAMLDAGIDAKVADRAAADQTALLKAQASAINPDSLKGVTAPAPQRGPRITPPAMGGGARSAGPVKVKTPQEAQSLKPGTHYVAPDGVERIR